MKKTTNYKKRRNVGKHDKLIKDTRIARKERLRRDGKYKRGMNLDGDDDDNIDVNNQQNTTTKKQKTKPTNRTCPHPFCGKTGHSTTRSKHCLANPKRLKDDGLEAACAAAVAAASATNDDPPQIISSHKNDNDAEDLDAMDALPFDATPPPTDNSDLDIFEDAGTWSEDEDGNVVRGII
jgi:hypothetical protein